MNRKRKMFDAANNSRHVEIIRSIFSDPCVEVVQQDQLFAVPRLYSYCLIFTKFAQFIFSLTIQFTFLGCFYANVQAFVVAFAIYVCVEYYRLLIFQRVNANESPHQLYTLFVLMGFSARFTLPGLLIEISPAIPQDGYSNNNTSNTLLRTFIAIQHTKTRLMIVCVGKAQCTASSNLYMDASGY